MTEIMNRSLMYGGDNSERSPTAESLASPVDNIKRFDVEIEQYMQLEQEEAQKERNRAERENFRTTSNYSEIIEVPVITKTIRRDRIIEVPEIHLIEHVQPKIIVKEYIRNVPHPKICWVEKITEVPQVQYVEKTVEIPQIHKVYKDVPRIEYREIIHEVPEYKYETIEKYVEVPEIKVIEKIIEVPQTKEVIKYVEKVEYIEVPYDTYTHVPVYESKIVEKIRHVPGEIEYVDVPTYNFIYKPVYNLIEKVVEEPYIEYIEVEKIIEVPCAGEVIEIPVEVPVYVDVPEYRKVEGKVIQVPIEKLYEKIIEIPVPFEKEEIFINKIMRPVEVEVIKEVEVVRYVDKIVEIPEYIQVPRAPCLIRPVHVEEVIHEKPIVETGPARYVYDQPIYEPPTYEHQTETVDTQSFENINKPLAVEHHNSHERKSPDLQSTHKANENNFITKNFDRKPTPIDIRRGGPGMVHHSMIPRIGSQSPQFECGAPTPAQCHSFYPRETFFKRK